MQQLTVLGATGSIGSSTLDVVSRHPERWAVFAITANTNVDAVLALIENYQPRYAVMACEHAAQLLQEKLGDSDTQVLAGDDGLVMVAEHEEVDIVMAAIVGGAGLKSSLAAAQAGKKVLLANKESLVMSGRLFMDAVAESGATLLPIDSEHNAIFQCMPPSYVAGQAPPYVSKILLTCSGGPFRDWSSEQMRDISVAQACAHPNWSMGRKISVDSATLMNKGLELIEACWLFNTPASGIEVVIHAQSVIHSLVQYNDGSVLAQLGNPDMRTPIAYGLAWPKRVASGVGPLDLTQIARLDFDKPDRQRFPCLALAEKAAAQGGSHSVVLNAANELAVAAFLNEEVGFAQIADVIAKVMDIADCVEPSTIAEVIEIDGLARNYAQKMIAQCQA